MQNCFFVQFFAVFPALVNLLVSKQEEFDVIIDDPFQIFILN
jgi:hypothetical protein